MLPNRIAYKIIENLSQDGVSFKKSEIVTQFTGYTFGDCGDNKIPVLKKNETSVYMIDAKYLEIIRQI